MTSTVKKMTYLCCFCRHARILLQIWGKKAQLCRRSVSIVQVTPPIFQPFMNISQSPAPALQQKSGPRLDDARAAFKSVSYRRDCAGFSLPQRLLSAASQLPAALRRAVLQRRKAGILLKHLREIGKIGIADLRRDQADGDVRVAEHRLRRAHLLGQDVVVQRGAGLALEEP